MSKQCILWLCVCHCACVNVPDRHISTCPVTHAQSQNTGVTTHASTHTVTITTHNTQDSDSVSDSSSSRQWEPGQAKHTVLGAWHDDKSLASPWHRTHTHTEHTPPASACRASLAAILVWSFLVARRASCHQCLLTAPWHKTKVTMIRTHCACMW